MYKKVKYASSKIGDHIERISNSVEMMMREDQFVNKRNIRSRKQ